MPNSDSGSDQPLAGVRVADLSRVLAGPYATMLLSDMGAEVVKVEHPNEGDDTRAWGPPWESGESAYFLSVNRGKRSLAVDLKDPDGAAAVREICAGCDIVIQNFRPGVIDRLGLDYASVRERNPAVVYCSISGFGPGHDPADRPGFDAIMQAESGLMSVTGAGDQASKVGVAITDVLTGLNAAVAILGALLRARVTGQGEHISSSLVNSALSGLVNIAQGALATDKEPQRYGNAHPAIVPYQVFATADADIMVAAGNDALFRKLCTVLGREDLSTDPRYITNPDRVAHRAELVAEIQTELYSRPAHEWTESLLEAGVPVGKVRGVLDAIRTADAAGDDITRTVDHPTAGTLELLRAGFRLGTAEGEGSDGSEPPPLLGQHSRQILTEVGLNADRISEMIERGAVRVASNGE